MHKALSEKKSSSLKGNKLLRRGEKYFLLEKTRVFVICTKKLCILGYPKCAQKILIRLRECANAQADLKLRLAYMSKGTSSHVAVHLIGFAKCEASYEAGHNDHTLFKYSSSVQPHTIASHGSVNGSGCSCMEVAVGYKEVYCIVKLRLMVG